MRLSSLIAASLSFCTYSSQAYLFPSSHGFLHRSRSGGHHPPSCHHGPSSLSSSSSVAPLSRLQRRSKFWATSRPHQGEEERGEGSSIAEEEEEEDHYQHTPATTAAATATKEGERKATTTLGDLREEISEKLTSLFGAMSNLVHSPEEGGVNVASTLARYKGGAGVTTYPRNGVIETIDLRTVKHDKKDCASEHAPAITTSDSPSLTTPTTRSTKKEATFGKVPDPVNENIARIGEKVPNAWLAVCHSYALKPKELKKIIVDEKPICLFRTASGEVKAISDICLHR